MKAYLGYNSLETDHQISSGTDVLIFSGDVAADWLDGVVVLCNGTTQNAVTISTVVYDDIGDETEITFVANVANTFPVGSKLYKFINPLKEACGILDGDADKTSFECVIAAEDLVAGPSDVRKYNSGSPYGISVLRGTSSSTYVWNPDLSQVELGFTPAIGDKIVAFSTGVWLFGDAFLAENVVEENYRDVYIFLTTEYDAIYAGLNEFASAEIGPEWYKICKEISPGVWEEYNNQTFVGYSAGDVIHIKVKAFIFDADTTVMNYYNSSLYLGHLEMPTN
jgi:hypothetical protein